MVRHVAVGFDYEEHLLVLTWSLLKRVLGAHLIPSPCLSLAGTKLFFSKFFTSSFLFVIGGTF